ncbi:UNVERIFIED_CONTAM: hypothetical protein Sradi_2564100 [Sesamum radiatum]|uniref:Integrase zinc-binding domain-containing protein n=1 Tax=Sesamum radiatum TaxID=300843 RepID=A0AAW2S5B2_SESRA
MRGGSTGQASQLTNTPEESNHNSPKSGTFRSGEYKRKVLTGDALPSWKDGIAYLKTGTLPQDPKEARAIRVRAGKFTLIGGRALSSKALRQGYFWPTMRKDAMDLVRKCQKCQVHANITHLPATPLQPIQSPCPFDQWGMDIVGKLLEHQDSGNTDCSSGLFLQMGRGGGSKQNHEKEVMKSLGRTSYAIRHPKGVCDG